MTTILTFWGILFFFPASLKIYPLRFCTAVSLHAFGRFFLVCSYSSLEAWVGVGGDPKVWRCLNRRHPRPRCLSSLQRAVSLGARELQGLEGGPGTGPPSCCSSRAPVASRVRNRNGRWRQVGHRAQRVTATKDARNLIPLSVRKCSEPFTVKEGQRDIRTSDTLFFQISSAVLFYV